MIQIEDLTDMVYRPKEGAIPLISEYAKNVHLPFVKLKDIRAEEKALLSLTASTAQFRFDLHQAVGDEYLRATKSIGKMEDFRRLGIEG
jgi:hypothetical protein